MPPTDNAPLDDLLASASRAMAAQKPTTAEQILKQAVAIAPDSAEAQRLLGVSQLMRGSPDHAIAYLRRAAELNPDDFNVHANLGSALFECQQADAALASMRRACELAPDKAAPWTGLNLGRALYATGSTEEARSVLTRALALDPSNIRLRMTLANVQCSLGNTMEAADLYRGVLKSHPTHASAWFGLCDLKVIKLDDIQIQYLRQLLERPNLTTDDRTLLGFALAKVLEDQGDLEGSFHALQAANAEKRRNIRWDIAEEHQKVEDLIAAFSKPLPPPPLDPTLGHEVIFIACLPRSGSTLVEQILSSHSQVEGTNEMAVLQTILRHESDRRQQPLPQWIPLATAGDWHRLGQEYLLRTAQWRKDKPRLTDKHLNNWILIGPALAMLPGARVVNTRRDPLETCFACYRQLFGDGSAFSYDFESLALHYADYNRISLFWKEHFPEHYHDHVYEDMLANPEGKIRELLAFCELPFEPACLEFHKTARTVRTASAAQVRQPLHSGTARSTRYGSLLDPLRDLLRQSGLGNL